MTGKRLTREQVEERLKDRESKIAGRIESIESSVPGRSLAKIRHISAEKKLKLSAFVAAGMVVGIFFALRRKSKKPVDLDEGVERLSARIADAIRDELDSGKDPDKAVRKALKSTPPILKLQETERSLLGETLHQFSRVLTREMARSGSKKLLRNLGIIEPDSDEEADESERPAAADGSRGR